jgi:hypothetical protein
MKSARMILLSPQNTMFLSYWEDLLDAVKKCKAAGVTPVAASGVSWLQRISILFLMER